MALTRADVIAKLSRYVADHFNGDYKAAFDHADMDRDGRISERELEDLLARAGINWWRSRVALAILEELDLDGDGRIHWDEFQRVFKPE